MLSVHDARWHDHGSKFVRAAVEGADVIMHTATLHKPHIVSHSRQDFVDTNVTGTLNVLEAALDARVAGVIFTSTTSTFGHALHPKPDEPTAWITEDVVPIPKNIYGVTKISAEQLAELFFRNERLPCLILRTSRFFPEDDDDPKARADYEGLNLKINELLYRRVDLADAVDAHLLAMERLTDIGFDKYIISATPPFVRNDVARLGRDAPSVVASLFPDYVEAFERRGWRMLDRLDRVYDNTHARADLGWKPKVNFRWALDRLRDAQPVFSALADTVGKKSYH